MSVRCVIEEWQWFLVRFTHIRQTFYTHAHTLENYSLFNLNFSNSNKYYEKALKVRRLIADDFNNAWRKGINILLTPTTLTDAPKYSEYIKKDEREQSAIQDYCTQPANMAGMYN